MGRPGTSHDYRSQPEDAGQQLADRARRAADPLDPVTITYDEFMEWADEDTLAEWVNGKVVMTSPASLRHQQVGGFLYRVLSSYVDVHDLGTVLNAPFQMKLPHSGREPDVIFIAKAHLDRLQQTSLRGPADLAVELVSPESITRDSVTKLQEYQQAAVPEYWLIDPDTEKATFYQLNEHGTYTAVAADSSGIYRSRTVPDFWLDVAWLWRNPLPGVEHTVLAVAGEAYARYLIGHMREEGFLHESDR